MKKFAAKRRELGWSQAELARRANMNPAEINRLESGVLGRAYPVQQRKIASALGLPVEELFDPQGRPLEVESDAR